MRIVVTGGSGKVGRAAIKALQGAGHKTVNFDLQPSTAPGAFVRVNCADFGALLGALSGVDTRGGVPDAVVHLAGIPAPGLVPDHEVFQNNLLASYNVFSAAGRLGIKRIVWASSETILGLPFRTPPDFAPLDETHPDRPEWSYSLSKQLGETMAQSFVRWRHDCTIVSLRFSNVFDLSDYDQIAAIHAAPKARRLNLWGYVDARDAGEACRLGIESSITGHEAFIIAAADTIMDKPSAELMATYYPEVPLRAPLDGFQSLLSSAKAGRLLSYKPRFSWRDIAA